MGRPDGAHTHGSGGSGALVLIAAAVLIGSGAASAAVSALVTILVVVGSVTGLGVLGGIAWLVHRARRDRRARPLYQLAADRQARYARYCDTARRGTFGPAAHFGLCTLTDALEVIGLPVDELERRALGRLAAGDPLVVAVVTDLLNRAASCDYDPARYAVPAPPERRLRAIPPAAVSQKEPESDSLIHRSSRKDSDSR